MAQFRDILLGNPRNSQTQPDIAALAAALDDLQSQTFSTRQELIDYINSGVTFSNGDVISYDGLFFKYQAPSSFIADLPNWVPAVVGTFRHFGALGDSRGLLSGDIDTPDGTNDATAIQAFWTWLGTVDNAIGRGEGLIYRSDSRHSIPGTGNFTFYPENMIMDHRGLPNADGDAVGSVLALHRSGAGDVTTIDVSSINVTTDSNQNEVVEVNTAAPHGLIVGDVFMLHSDDVIAPGHDAVNERRGQFSTVKRVVDADTVEIAEPLYEALPSSPKMNRYAWAENFSFVGEMSFLGPGRRSGSDGNPSIIGFTGPSFINCRDFNLGVINTFRIDYQALSIDNCYNYNVDHWNGYFDRVTPGTDGAIQYGVTYKNACTRGTVKKITATNGRHGAFDWTRNTNPGIGRNCTIMNIEATGCWRSAIAMHGNARDCFVTSARLTNCLDGLEIRSPGWTATDIEGNNLRYVVRLTDDPKNTVLRNIRGNDVAYVIRFAAGLTGYIGVDPVKDIVIDGVFGNEVSNNTVFIDASLPVFTQADGAVVAGTTTSMTIPDLSNTLYNNAGTMTGWEVTVDPDGAGTATEVVRVATHSRVGGNNVLSWSTPIGTAPVPGVATYTLRGFADDITVTNVKSRNCLFADIAITPANIRNLITDGVHASSEALINQPVILIQGTADRFVRSPKLSQINWSNKRVPNISSFSTDVEWTRLELQETLRIPTDFATLSDAMRVLGETVPGDSITLQFEANHQPTTGITFTGGNYSGYTVASANQATAFLGLTGNITVVAGETLTQASSGATGVVVNDGSLTDSRIMVSGVTGTFNTTNELTGSTSGALGANSVPVLVHQNVVLAPNMTGELITGTDTQLPALGCLVVGSGLVGGVQHGYQAFGRSTGRVNTGSGVVNVWQNGLIAQFGADVAADGSIFTYAAQNGATSSGIIGHSSRISASGANTSRSGYYGVQAAHSGDVNFQNGVSTHCGRYNTRETDGGTLNIDGATVTNGGVESVRVFNNAIVNGPGIDARDSAGTGLSVSRASVGNFPESANFTGAGTVGASVSQGSVANLMDADLSGAATSGLRSTSGSLVNAGGVNARVNGPGGADSANDFVVDTGGIIALSSTSVGGLSQQPNVIKPKGLIFSPNDNYTVPTLSLGSNQNNYDVSPDIQETIRLTTTATRQITGLANGYSSAKIKFLNVSASSFIRLVHQSASSSAGNRFSLPHGQNFYIYPGCTVELEYATDSWFLVAETGNTQMPPFTVASLPSASTLDRAFIWVSDETGGPVPAYSDGTNWRRVSDGNVVS